MTNSSQVDGAGNDTITKRGAERIASLVFTTLAIPILSYLTLALVYFNCKKYLFPDPERPRVRNKENKGAQILNVLLTISPTSALCYVIIEVVLFGEPPAGFCTYYHQVKILTYGITVTAVYVTLWFRVFIAFYWDKVTKKSTSKFAQVFNLAAIVLVMSLTLANFVVFLSSPLYLTEVYGCVKPATSKSTYMKWIILGVTNTICQSIMLLSLVYPLHLHRKRMLGRGFNANIVIPMIKRSAIMTATCICSDVAASIFSALYRSPTVYMNHVVLSLNLLVNVICVLCSFADYQEKVFPFPCCRSYVETRKRNRRSQQARSRGTSLSVVTQQ